MASKLHPPDEAKDALVTWRNTDTQAWRRVPCGWHRDAEDDVEVAALRVANDVNGQPFLSIDPQRRIRRGPGAGTWTNGTSSTFHTAEEFQTFLNELVNAGMLAGFLPRFAKLADYIQNFPTRGEN